MTRLTNIKHVQQGDPQGCTLACIAMIIGWSYQEVKRVAQLDPDPRMERYGHIRPYWEEWLYRNGFAIQNHARVNPTTNQQRLVWPIPLWAEVHVCSVDIGGGTGTHLIVVKYDGTVFDPAQKTPTLWDDYKGVMYMSGVYDVGRSAQQLTTP